MKFCPYCGADLLDADVLFCAHCGKKLPPHEASITEPLTEEMRPMSQEPTSETYRDKKKKKTKPKRNEKKSRAMPTEEPVPVDDGYDGYYNDVLPPDMDRTRDGIDKELVKKIVILGVSVLLIISLCVVMMYML